MAKLRATVLWSGIGLAVVLLLLWVTHSLSPIYCWMVRYFAPEVWSAIAAWITAAVAVAAAIVAWHQVQVARQTREELAQPNVALFAELNETDWQIIEIVVKNFGNTPAYDITFDFGGRPLMRCPIDPAEGLAYDADVRTVYFPEKISYLAPGQEWRTVWDDSQGRREYIAKANEKYPNGVPENRLLRKRHEISLRYKDLHTRELPEVPCVIDFQIYDETVLLKVKTMDDLVNAITKQTESQTLIIGLMTGTVEPVTPREKDHPGTSQNP